MNGWMDDEIMMCGGKTSLKIQNEANLGLLMLEDDVVQQEQLVSRREQDQLGELVHNIYGQSWDCDEKRSKLFRTQYA